jgi:hypothetical protein
VEDFGSPTNWTITTPGYASAQSIYIPNFNSSDGIAYEFHSSTLNAEGLTSFAISYDWAYAQRNSGDADLFRILVSNDCGDSWQVKKSYSGISSLPSVSDTIPTPFTPSGTNEWNSDTIYLNSSNLTDHLMVKFYFKGSGGNHFYLDNIRMGHPDVLGIAAKENLELTAFPNPANDQVILNWNGPGAVNRIRLVNAMGQTVLQQEVTSEANSAQLELTAFANGYYIICAEGKTANHYLPQLIRK